MAVVKLAIKTEYIEGDGYRLEIKKGEDVLIAARQLTADEVAELVKTVAKKAV